MNPGACSVLVLVSALRNQVHVVIGDVEYVQASFVYRVRVVDLPTLVEEDADPRSLRARPPRPPVVVLDLTRIQFLGSERDPVVEVEIAVRRGVPGECPTHPCLVRGELRVRCPRHGGHRDVAMVQVGRDAVEVVHPEGTDEARRVGCPWRVLLSGLWIEHRVVDDQLAPPFENLAQRLPTILAVEEVLLLDRLPREVAALVAELIAKAGELLFFGEVLSFELRAIRRVSLLCGFPFAPPTRARRTR